MNNLTQTNELKKKQQKEKKLSKCIGLILFSEKIKSSFNVCIYIVCVCVVLPYFSSIFYMLYGRKAFHIQPYESTKNYKLQTENVA